MREFKKSYQYIRPSDIAVDTLYQRVLDENRVNRIVKRFNINLVNPPKVSFRDGKYWVFDGQHTLAAWKVVNKDKPIECRVFLGMTWLEEMELFVAQNGDDKDPTTNDKLRALYNGGDPDVKDMVKAAKMAGVTVDFVQSKLVGRCRATSSLFKAYKALNRLEFVDMLTAIMEAWPDDPDALANQIILGMTRFYLTYSGKFNRKLLTKSLSRVSPNTIIRDGKGYGGSKDVTYARLILRLYNKNRSKNCLEDEI